MKARPGEVRPGQPAKDGAAVRVADQHGKWPLIPISNLAMVVLIQTGCDEGAGVGAGCVGDGDGRVHNGYVRHPILWNCNAKVSQLVDPCWRILREEKLVELRRGHLRARQHGMDLAAVMDLVDEQVAEDSGHSFPVVDAVVSVDRDDAREAWRGQVLAKGNQPPVYFELGRAEFCRRAWQVGRADGDAAGTGQVSEVASVDEEDVPQRLAQRREKADPGGRERLRSQPGASAA